MIYSPAPPRTAENMANAMISLVVSFLTAMYPERQAAAATTMVGMNTDNIFSSKIPLGSSSMA